MLLGEKLSRGPAKTRLWLCRLIIIFTRFYDNSPGKTQGTMLLGEKLSRGPAKTRLWSCRLLTSSTQKLPPGFGTNWPSELVRAAHGCTWQRNINYPNFRV